MNLAQNVCLGRLWNCVILSKNYVTKETIVNILEVTFVFGQSSWILLKMYVFIVSRSGSNWITWDDNLGHRSKSKENLVNTVEVAFLSNHHKSCSKCLACWFLGQVWKWVTWGQKLGHWFKSQANLVNTLEVTFWNDNHELCSKCLACWF